MACGNSQAGKKSPKRFEQSLSPNNSWAIYDNYTGFIKSMHQQQETYPFSLFAFFVSFVILQRGLGGGNNS